MSFYPATWDETTLEQFGEVVSGGTPDRNNPAYWKGEIPWVTPSEITTNTGKYLYDTREKITEAGLNASSAKLLPVNSLLITSRATLGEIAIAAIPVSTNQGFKSIIPNNDTDPLFAYYLIKTLKGEMVRLSSGTTFLEISKGDFSRIVARRPQLPEQTRIAYVLDTIDEAIAKTEAVIAKLKQVRAGMLHDLLSYGLDESGQLRDPIAHPEQFKDSALGRMPRDWEVFEIWTIGEIVTGRTPPSSEPGAWGKEVPFITPAEITTDGMVLSPERLISEHGKNFTRELPAFSVLVVCIGSTLGKVAVAPWPCVTNQQINAIICKTDHQHGFVSAMVSHHIRQLHRWAGLQAVPIVNKSQFGRMMIPVAPTSEQIQIAEAVEQSDRNILTEVNECQKLKNLKSGLQDDLLTGRVRIPETIREGAAGV